MRALIFELRPGALAEEGLGAALTKQAAAIAAREQIVIDVVAPPRRLPISTDAEEHLYRIALEALHNAVKHARPRRIDVVISADADSDAVEGLTVTDDGIGFDTSVEHLGHLGLGTMRERATFLGGSTTVASERGVGTRVTVVVPVDAGRSTADAGPRAVGYVIRPRRRRPLIPSHPAVPTDASTRAWSTPSRYRPEGSSR